MAEPPMVNLKRRVCSGRDQARVVVASRPDVDPRQTVYVNAANASAGGTFDAIPSDRLKELIDKDEFDSKKGVQILTPSFADELLKAWPRAQLVGATKEVQDTWDFVVERQEADHG